MRDTRRGTGLQPSSRSIPDTSRMQPSGWKLFPEHVLPQSAAIRTQVCPLLWNPLYCYGLASWVGVWVLSEKAFVCYVGLCVMGGSLLDCSVGDGKRLIRFNFVRIYFIEWNSFGIMQNVNWYFMLSLWIITNMRVAIVSYDREDKGLFYQNFQGRHTKWRNVHIRQL